MAYITAEETRAIKKKLNKAFPEFKFSVRNRHSLSVSVTLLSGPADFSTIPTGERYGRFDPFNPVEFMINEYRLNWYGEYEDFFTKIVNIVNVGNYNNSDIMTDYFDVGFYTHFHVGAWDMPFVSTLEEVTA
jgi:hypothetical protein